MKNITKCLAILVMTVLLASPVTAQTLADGRDSLRVHGSVMVMSDVYSVKGATKCYTSLWPSLDYKINNRLSFRGSAMLMSDIMGMPHYEVGRNRSLAPLRRPSRAVGLHGRLKYTLDNGNILSFAAYGVSGGLSTPLNDYFDIDVLGFEAAMRFRIFDNNYLDVYLNVLRDRSTVPVLPLMMYSHPGMMGLYDPFYF